MNATEFSTCSMTASSIDWNSSLMNTKKKKSLINTKKRKSIPVVTWTKGEVSFKIEAVWEEINVQGIEYSSSP